MLDVAIADESCQEEEGSKAKSKGHGADVFFAVGWRSNSGYSDADIDNEVACKDILNFELHHKLEGEVHHQGEVQGNGSKPEEVGPVFANQRYGIGT